MEKRNSSFKTRSNLAKVENIISYVFEDKELLQKALIHRSYLNEKSRDDSLTNHNERLEFLGDAVLELIVSDYLYKQLDVDEGQMTKLRSSLVKGKINAEIGIKLGLDGEILLSKGELEDFGKARPSIVADCVEAILGAMYLDGGLKSCLNFIQQNMLVLLPQIIDTKSYDDYKTILQEYCQKTKKITPKYKVISETGKDHNKIYICGVWIDNKLFSQGTGRTKQEAETEAAKIAYEQLSI
ncbi:ribonuclease III [Candidatus Gracilibacteria bacterium]|nr:ribonuclease III [Candidatus Gracilibacteria bacterium]